MEIDQERQARGSDTRGTGINENETGARRRPVPPHVATALVQFQEANRVQTSNRGNRRGASRFFSKGDKHFERRETVL